MGNPTPVTYTLTFQNNSTNAGNVCVYQTNPGSGPNIMPLAWFAEYAYPTTEIEFDWTESYSFVWAQTGQLVPGVIFNASQSWPADLSTLNQVTFTSANSTYTFKNQMAGTPAGSLYISEDNTIPLGLASVGIGMSGAGTFAVQAQPNLQLAFTPTPTYWITFGNYVQGQVLDIQTITNTQEIQFTDNVYAMTATLNSNNTWTIAPSA